MNENEKELLSIIRTHDDPGLAAEIALNLLIDFLAKREAPQGTSSAHHR
jgi:hypothetical protein